MALTSAFRGEASRRATWYETRLVVALPDGFWKSLEDLRTPFQICQVVAEVRFGGCDLK
jgi:hypothetical protein